MGGWPVTNEDRQAQLIVRVGPAFQEPLDGFRVTAQSTAQAEDRHVVADQSAAIQDVKADVKSGRAGEQVEHPLRCWEWLPLPCHELVESDPLELLTVIREVDV